MPRFQIALLLIASLVAGCTEKPAGQATVRLALARCPETSVHCRRRATEYDWETAIVPFLEKLYSGAIRGELFGDGSRRAA